MAGENSQASGFIGQHLPVTSKDIQVALDINERLASLFHIKFPLIPRDEFVSAGLVGIAKANRRFISGNWGGYSKVAIQNEMVSYCRQYRRYTRIKEEAYRITHSYSKYRKTSSSWFREPIE